MDKLSLEIFEKINKIALPYFRGYYSEAEEAGRIAVVQSKRPNEKNLFEGLSTWITEHQSIKSQKKLDNFLEKLPTDLDILNSERRVYLYFGHLCYTWVSSTLRDINPLRLAIHEADLAQEIFLEAENNKEFLPGLWMVHDCCAWAHYHLGQTEKAIEEINLSVRAVNNWIKKIIASESFTNVNTRQQLKEKIPNFARTMATRGLYFFELGDFDSAMEDMNIAVEIDPENPYCWAERGIVRWAKNDISAAINDIEKACAVVEQHAGSSDFKSSGRWWYFRALISVDARKKSLQMNIPNITKDLINKYFKHALTGFLKTQRCRDAICTSILRLDILKQKKHMNEVSRAAAVMLWELLSAFDGADDYVGNYLTNQIKSRNYLLKET